MENNTDLLMIPYVVLEANRASSDKEKKQLWIVIILLIIMLVGTNGAWLWYESQFETVTTTEITQENSDGYNNYIGNDGDINNGNAENKDH